MPAALTEKQYRARLRALCTEKGWTIKHKGAFVGMKVPATFECSVHGEFLKKPQSVLYGSAHGCGKCGRSASKTQQPSNKALYLKLAKQHEISVLSYTSANARVSHKCLKCDGTWEARPYKLLKGRGCPLCEGAKLHPVRKLSRRFTEQSFAQAIVDLYPEVRIKAGSFAKLTGPVIWKCSKHGVHERTGSTLLKTGCPFCYKEGILASWHAQIAARHGDTVRLLGQYRGCKRSYRFKCYKCFRTWKNKVYTVMSTDKGGCPKCARKPSRSGCPVKEFSLLGKSFRVQGYEFQAITWLVERMKVSVENILTESTGKVPVIPYTYYGKKRNYYPDIYLPQLKRIIEVKSGYTLGVNGRSKFEQKQWRKNQAKAKATMAAGYLYTLLVMTESGTRVRLPEKWYEMSAKDVLVWLAYNNAEFGPEGRTKVRSGLPEEAQSRLGAALVKEKNERAVNVRHK